MWNYTTGDEVDTVAISADGEYIAAGSRDNSVYLFKQGSSDPLWNYETDGIIRSVDISANGSYIVAGSNDYGIYLFHKDSSTPLWNYTSKGYAVSVSISADGTYIAACAGSIAGKELYLFERNSSTPVWTKSASSSFFLDVAICDDGNYIVAGSGDKNVYLFHQSSSTPLWNYDSGESVNTVSISSNGSFIAAGADKDIHFFHKGSSTPLWSYEAEELVKSVSVSGDGKFIAAGTDYPDERVHLFSNENSTPLWRVTTDGRVNSVATTANGSFIAAGAGGSLPFYKQSSSEAAWKYDECGFITSVSVSADGKYIAAGSKDNNVYLLEKRTPPTAEIDTYIPNYFLKGETVEGEGHGIDEGEITEYRWESSIDGVLSSSPDFSTSTLSFGKHWINFTVKDDEGMWSDPDSRLVWIHEKPVAQIKSISPSPVLLDASVHFVGKGIDDGEIATYVWSSDIDGEIYNGSEPELNFSELSHDEHNISLVVKDTFGVWSKKVTLPLVVHRKPLARILKITPNPGLVSESTLFEGEGVDDYFINRYVWRTEEKELYNGTEFEFSLSDLSTGEHTIYLKVEDSYGVWSDEDSEEFVIHEKPTAEITDISPNPALNTETIKFEGDASDDGEIEEYLWRVFNETGAEVHQDDKKEFTLSELPRGVYNISFMAQDDLGAWTERVNTSLVIHEKPSAEIMSISPNPTVKTGITNFTGKGLDDGTVVRYAWSSSIDDEFYNGTEPKISYSDFSEGNHTIILRVQDNYGIWSEPFTRPLLVHESPVASIDSVSPDPAIQGDEVSFSGDGDDDSSVEIYRWTSSLDGEIYEGNEASFSTVNLSIGTHTITLKVQDSHGAWSESVTTTLEVKEYAPPANILPVVTITSPQDGAELEGTVTIKGSTSDEDGTVEKVDISVDGEWFTVTGVTSWEFELDTTTLDNGEYVLKVLSYDGEDYSNDTLLSITVKNEKKDNGGEEAGFLPGFEIGISVVALFASLLILQRKR